MAYMGILVQYLVASKDRTVNTLTITGRSQLDADTIVLDTRNASKIIHVEMIIGCAKTFKIMKKPLSSEQTCMGGRIIFVCFMLTNFRPSIVGRRA